MLPADRRFPDLERLLDLLPAADHGAAPDPIRDTPVMGTNRSSETTGGWASLPYFMPERPFSSVELPAPTVPDYVAPRDRDRVRRSADADRQRQAERAAVAAEVEPPPSLVWVWALRLTAVIVAMVAMVVVGVVAIVGGGAMLVSSARSTAAQQGVRLQHTLEQEVGVVYQMRGDRNTFEEIYEGYRTARGPDRLTAALRFVEALDAAVTNGAPMDTGAMPKVRRLQSARDGYLRSRSDWGDTARSFPGSVAVRIGLAQIPGPLP